MTKSLLQGGKACYITGARTGLHRHHIYGGGRRKASEEWGCWVWLRADWHNMASYGVHFDRELDLQLKQDCQRAFEALHGHEAFMAAFGRNYLDDADPEKPEPQWRAEEDFEPTEETFAPWENGRAGDT